MAGIVIEYGGIPVVRLISTPSIILAYLHSQGLPIPSGFEEWCDDSILISFPSSNKHGFMNVL
uniref:WGS project CBMI000000000 data, contig CS3069_c000306 n=1 Tax=Fusarium clavum TaxID=2594811 RepID=A0A090MEJ1_9HYPO|nr:unnamed protein product [Fusarium clavum]